MDDVKRFKVCPPGFVGPSTLNVVKLSDHMEALDAQRLRADTAEAELAKIEEKRQIIASAYLQLLDALGNKDMAHSDALSAIAADKQRIEELLVMLRQAWVDECVSAEDCRKIDAALNQKSEGESQDPDDLPPPGEGWKKPDQFRAVDLDCNVRVHTAFGHCSGPAKEFNWSEIDWWRFEQ